MIPTFPRPGQRISASVAITDTAVTYAPHLVSLLPKQLAAEVLDHIMSECTTSRKDDTIKATIHEVDVVVLSRNEYDELVRGVYLAGKRDAARMVAR